MKFMKVSLTKEELISGAKQNKWGGSFGLWRVREDEVMEKIFAICLILKEMNQSNPRCNNQSCPDTTQATQPVATLNANTAQMQNCSHKNEQIIEAFKSLL